MKKILVTGANGYLASYIRKENQDVFEWVCMTRKDADLNNPESVESFLKHRILTFVFIRRRMRQPQYVKKIQKWHIVSMWNLRKKSLMPVKEIMHV